MVPANLSLIGPSQYGVAGTFSPIIAYDHLGLASRYYQAIEFSAIQPPESEVWPLPV